MTKKRKRHNAEFKARVALEAVKGLKTSSELAREFQVHPTQISQWKRQLLEMLPEVFRNGKVTPEVTEQELTAPLYEEIGRLKIELDWVKKSAAKLHGG
jgi:transposase-like protein